MSETIDLGPSFSKEEDSYFESGGNTPIPSDAGSDAAGGGDPAKVEPVVAPAADKDGDKGGDKVEKMVSLAALHEERTKRQLRDTELRETREKLANLEGKFSIIERLNAPEPAAPAKVPTAEEDIFGAVKHAGETIAQMQKRLDDADAATKTATEETAKRATFVNNYKSDAAKFTEAKPDYMEAYNFILESRAAELRAIGYDTPEALHNALTADEMGIAEMAFAKGKSPAEMLYALATQRGYKPKAAAPAAAAKPAAEEVLETIERGQNANKSLSDLGGEAPGGAMTAAVLLAMPMDEFEAWTAKNPAKAKRIMGG
jgi:hypothetical protein